MVLFLDCVTDIMEEVGCSEWNKDYSLNMNGVVLWYSLFNVSGRSMGHSFERFMWDGDNTPTHAIINSAGSATFLPPVIKLMTI